MARPTRRHRLVKPRGRTAPCPTTRMARSPRCRSPARSARPGRLPFPGCGVADVLLDQLLGAQPPREALHVGAELRISAFGGVAPACSTSSPSGERTMTAANSQESAPAPLRRCGAPSRGPSPAGSASAGERRRRLRARRPAAWRSTRRRPRRPPRPRGGAAPRPRRGSALTTGDHHVVVAHWDERRVGAPVGPHDADGGLLLDAHGRLAGLGLAQQRLAGRRTSTVPAQLAPRPAPPSRRRSRPAQFEHEHIGGAQRGGYGPDGTAPSRRLEMGRVHRTSVESTAPDRNDPKGPRQARLTFHPPQAPVFRSRATVVGGQSRRRCC